MSAEVSALDLIDVSCAKEVRSTNKAKQAKLVSSLGELVDERTNISE